MSICSRWVKVEVNDFIFFFPFHIIIFLYAWISQSQGTYYAPKLETIGEYRQYIEDLPQIDELGIFGMHENANIAFQINETNTLIGTILDVQPRLSSGGVGKSNDDIVDELAQNITGKLMNKLDIEQASAEMFQVTCKLCLCATYDLSFSHS